MKIRSYEDYITKINDDLVWRKKEINYVFLQANSNRSLNQKFYIRAGIAILYSHWEGYIKNASELYLIHVKSQKKNFEDLKPNFLTIKFMNELKNCTNSENQKYFNEVLKNILSMNKQRANFGEYNIIKTNSNLTSSVLVSILTIIGIDLNLFELKYKQIDEILVKSRNEIVHGDDVNFEFEIFKELKESVIEMLNEFKDKLENAAVSKEYCI